MESMMTLVTANIASGSRETTMRTPIFVITMRGDASQTIRKIGKVLRSAAMRSFQRGTGLAICGSKLSIPENLSLEFLHLSPPTSYTPTQQQRPKNALLCSPHITCQGRKASQDKRRVKTLRGTITTPCDVFIYMHP